MRAKYFSVPFEVLCLALIAFCAPGPHGHARAQSIKPGQTADPLALAWPRFFATNGFEFAVYQPQITDWPSNQLVARLATAVRPAGTSNETYGAVFFTCRTEIDKVNGLVTLENFVVTRVEFPTQRGMQPVYQAIFQGELPQAAKVIPLDHLEAAYAVSAEIEKVKIQPVLNTPPQFIYESQPSLLVQIDGSPILKPLLGAYQRMVNTRAVLLYDSDPINQGFYLYAAGNWYSASTIQGPWTVNTFPPADIGPAMEAALATKQVDPAAPRQPLASPPAIVVATVPTELLQTTGAANLLSILGTDLLYVSNTDQAIFYFLDDANYYVLMSGRWFKCTSLYGPWTFVPSASLPADFKNIPPDSPKSNVLLSVAGTAQAQQAVIASTIPQTATVYRNKAALTVQYVGAPSFVAVQGTPMFYAANTMTPVIMMNAYTYYACENGLWFLGSTPNGPWTVATTVPALIYTIPTSCPIHYVTYAYIYGYTTEVVYVGYTPGYLGVVVVPGGIVVYGTGYVYPPVVVGTTYVSYPPTYGYGASLAMGAAAGFALGYCAGHSTSCYYPPHWGCYAYPDPYHAYSGCNVNSYSCYSHYGTATTAYGYNPYTGTEAKSSYASGYNPYTGTHGTVSSTSTYNPYSGQGTKSASASAYNPYTGASASGHASGTANAYTGNYSGSSSSSGYNPSTGRSYSGSSSVSGNAYNGNYNASHTSSTSSQYTGETASDTKSVSGNAYNGTASVNNSGSAENSKTGNSYSWNNGSMTADKDGTTSSYTKGDTSANESSYQSSHPSSSSYSSAESDSSHSGGGSYGDSHSYGGSSSSYGGSHSYSGGGHSGGRR